MLSMKLAPEHGKKSTSALVTAWLDFNYSAGNCFWKHSNILLYGLWSNRFFLPIF